MRMWRKRSTALAEERASSSRTCEREYSLGTNQLSGRRRRRMWRRSLSFILPVKQDEEPWVKYSATSRLVEGVEMSK